jgi:hypothetical protein
MNKRWRNLIAIIILSLLFYVINKIVDVEGMVAIGLAMILVSLGNIEENTDKNESES